MVSTGDCRLARRAQAFAGWGRVVFVWLSLASALALAGCGAGSFSIEDAIPDRSVLTGAISRKPPPPPDPVAMSDEETIRNAVTSAIVDEVGDGGLGWANASTGSRGAISQISERQDGNRLCRRFTASRESFEGVHMYRGETCLGPAKIWLMTGFNRVE